MRNIAVYSIGPLAGDGDSRGWRIASAVVPVGIAALTVTREEVCKVSPGHGLLLETIHVLEQEGVRATVSAVAQLAGIVDEALMAGILVPLANQGLVLIDGDCVRQSPALTMDGEDARIVVEREEEVCVIGNPGMPTYGIDRQRLSKLSAFDIDAGMVAVSEEVLESWRSWLWDAQSFRLQLREPLRRRLYVLEGTVKGEYVLCDERAKVPIELPAEHPVQLQLRAEVQPILEAAPRLLRQYGTWNAETSELHCTGEQWACWRAVQGGEVAEVILRGSIDVAINVRCRPADANAAQVMLLENVVGELDGSPEPCTAERVELLANTQRQSDLLRPFNLATPTLAEVESAAWSNGRWELAYRIAAPADGL